jgi:hypothetical protein
MRLLPTIGLLFFTTSALAQHAPGGGSPPVRTAPAEARQFDFLLGQWELDVKPQATTLAARIHGVPKMLGTWKAWRALDGWGVIDELRITDESGNPRSLTSATRMYDATTRHWVVSTADAYRNVMMPSTAIWADNRMTATSRGADADGKAFLSRSRYVSITPTSFSFEQERSTDDGKTWTRTLTIRAKRVSATAPR